MTWNFDYTPQIWPPVITILVLVALAVYSIRHRDVPGALPFALALLLGILWMVGVSLGVAAATASAKIFWIEYQAAWLLPSATAVTCFLLEYAKPGRWLTRRNLALLSLPCLLNVGMILTNNLHHLAWQGFVLGREVIPLSGLGSSIFLIYAYALGLVNLVVLVWLFIRSPQQRWPVALMLTGQMAGRVVYALATVQIIHSTLPIEVIAFWFPLPMYVIALFGFRFLNPIPLARQVVIEQMREGMLVVDREGRLASLNPAAFAILGLPGKQVSGRRINEILPSIAEGGEESTAESDISLVNGAEIRNYLLSTSLLKDWRGQEAGRLLLLHDVTSRKQAEAALNESREIQRLIFDKSFDGISIYEERPEEDQRILVDCNERYCQLAGRSKEELLAIQDTRSIQRVEDPHEESDRVSVEAEQAFSGVFSWIRPDGKQNIIEYNAAPIRVGDRFYTIGVDRDITQSRLTQTQILEQQRALAMLHERERLARELHDSIGQVLGYVSLQAQAIRKRAQGGDLPAVEAQLTRLAEVAQAAHADVRDSILSLNAGAGRAWSFQAALWQYLDAYREQYSIRAELSLPEGWADGIFEPEAEVQLLRVIQEALTNARKHGKPGCVQVMFAKADSLVRLTIQDDGVGFDPSQAAGEGHYGLHFMRERIEQIGGNLRVQSTPGQGTRVVIEIPKDLTQSRLVG